MKKQIKQNIENVSNTSALVGPTEGTRRVTEVGPTKAGRSIPISPPDPEVKQKPRRKFTAKYKLRILEETDKCSQPGEIGALLRREGLYFSNLTTWRRQKDQGLLSAMAPKKRGRKAKKQNPLASKVASLQRENEKLQNRLKKAELIIEAQKKISEILGITQKLNER